MNGNRRPQIRTPWPSATWIEKWGCPHHPSDGDMWKGENDNSLRFVHYQFYLHPLVRKLFDLFSIMLAFLDKHSFLFYLRTTPTFTELPNTKFLDVLLDKTAAAAAAAAKSLQSCPTLRPHRRQPTMLPRPWDSPGKNTGVGCHFLLQCMKVESESEVPQSCPTLSDPMDCSLPGSSVHGIFQAKVLEWGAIAFSGTRQQRLLITLHVTYKYA